MLTNSNKSSSQKDVVHQTKPSRGVATSTTVDCKNFGAFITKMAPANTGKWDVVLKESKKCYKKTSDPYFKDLISRYGKKVKQQEKDKAEMKKLISKLGPVPLGSAAKRYIKKIARDPSSVKNVECDTAGIGKAKSYWVQTCAFDGKNAFGGYIRQKINVKIKDNVGIGHF